jgi:hypothetical protein
MLPNLELGFSLRPRNHRFLSQTILHSSDMNTLVVSRSAKVAAMPSLTPVCKIELNSWRQQGLAQLILISETASPSGSAAIVPLHWSGRW